MKIAFLAPRFHTNQLKLIEYLSQNNNVVFYVTRVGKSEDHTSLKPSIIELNKIFKLLRQLIKNKNDYFNYRFGFPSFRELNNFRKHDFDVIIIRNPYSIMTMVYTIMSKFTKTKVIFYTQREIHSKVLTKKDIFINILIKVFDAKWISPLLGNSNYDKISQKMYYIPFCMDVINYNKNWFIDDTVNILSIGKFVRWKNHDLLIKALIPLASKYKFSLTIIGEVSEVTDDEYYNSILELSEQAPFEVNIKTNLDRKKVFEEYKKHDIFVLPSTNEPASVSNLEAMSFGLPVLTSDSNKTSTYTQGNGYIFKSDSIEDLKSCLVKLLEDRNKILEMGKKSLEVVEKSHNSNVVYKYFYDEILDA